jgi:dihydroorotase
VYEGRLSLRRLVEVLSAEPARILGIRAGRIKPGYLANLILVKFPGEFLISGGEERRSACS